MTTPHDRGSWACDPDALVPVPDAQYGTVCRCPVCAAEYVDDDAAPKLEKSSPNIKSYDEWYAIALVAVCQVADEWAGEYGFTDPARATLVRAAIFALAPAVLSQRDRDYFSALTPGLDT